MSDQAILEAARRLWPDQDGTGFGYFDFLHARGSPRAALVYSRLFWPEFISFEEMLFLEGTLEDDADRARVLEALRRHKGNRTATEREFNCTEIPSLFGGRSTETTAAEDNLLATQIRAMWSARLRDLFPDREFAVELQLPEEEGSGEIAVVFYERR